MRFWQHSANHICLNCGGSNPLVLEFHHLSGKDKDISYMNAGGYPITAIEAEIAKCVVLCANCHRRKTAKERGWFRNST